VWAKGTKVSSEPRGRYLNPPQRLEFALCIQPSRAAAPMHQSGVFLDSLEFASSRISSRASAGIARTPTSRRSIARRDYRRGDGLFGFWAAVVLGMAYIR